MEFYHRINNQALSSRRDWPASIDVGTLLCLMTGKTDKAFSSATFLAYWATVHFASYLLADIIR
jgi:hypothetical protein